jgi:hypothetical protein
MKCQECGEKKATQEDPRDPPLDEGKCLCPECCVNAIDAVIEEHKEEISNLKNLKKALA